MAGPDISAARIDRWLTLSIVSPWRGLVSGPHRPAIPILMYHSVSDEVDDAVHPYFRTVTTPAVFARHVAHLRARGYAAVTLSEATRLLHDPAHIDLAGKVVLTFDDGFRDFFTAAHPILERAGFAATVFLASAYVDRTFLTGRDCLRSSEIRALSESGVEFGSHSVSHRRLVDLEYTELVEEVRGSKTMIEDITGQAVTLFSYPYRFPEENGSFTRLLGGLLDASGYRAGVTTAIGRSQPADDLRFLPRLPVNDRDDTRLLQAKLDGHYDWLRAGQLFRKKARAALQRWRPS